MVYLTARCFWGTLAASVQPTKGDLLCRHLGAWSFVLRQRDKEGLEEVMQELSQPG